MDATSTILAINSTTHSANSGHRQSCRSFYRAKCIGWPQKLNHYRMVSK